MLKRCRGVVSDSLDDSLSYNIHRSSSRTTVNTDSLRVQFSEMTVDGGANLASYIFIIDILRLNGSNITCEAFLDSSNDRDTVTICVMGKACDIHIEHAPHHRQYRVSLSS